MLHSLRKEALPLDSFTWSGAAWLHSEFKAAGRRLTAPRYGEVTLKLKIDAEVSSGIDHAAVRASVDDVTKFAIADKSGELDFGL